MRINLSLSHKGLLLVSIPLLFELVFVGMLSWLLLQAEVERERETRAREVIAHASNSILLLVSTIAGLMNHIGPNRSLPEKDFTERFSHLQQRFKEEISSLQDLVKDHYQELVLVDLLETRERQCLEEYQRVNSSFEQGQMMEGLRELGNLKTKLREAQLITDQVTEQVRSIAAASPESQAEMRRRIQLLLLGGVIFNIFIAVALAVYFNRGTTRRLAVLMDNTARLEKHQELNPPVAGGDEIARLDHTFHSMANNLAQAEKSKQEYVAMISHDLRSPLTSIQFVLAMIAGGTYGELSDAGVARAQSAESSAQRLISLINTLLDLEKMEAGKLEMRLSEVSLSSVIERSVEAIFSLADLSGITIETSKTESIIHADADRLVQVLVNLISNAIKFSPRGSAVTIAVQDLPGFAELRVIDRGRGIPATHIKAIFDRFQQVEASDAKERGGTGLGLAICKAIVEGHGGTIGIESEFGEGSTFWFRIPLYVKPQPSVQSGSQSE